jgi:S-formylglutathione hydrolase
MQRTLVLRLALMLVVVLGVAGFVFSQTAPDKTGTVEHIKVHAKSLEGNLLGDSADRDVFVYLPPSYQTSRNQRYPVVYLLHGYGLTAERWVPFIGLPGLADKDIEAGNAKEMIMVSPDSFNKYNGAMYSSSPTNGDWETFLTKELVAYVDKNYRTLANRDSRGLAGHSMGGYGTWRLAMKYPDVFSSIYAMSSCCLMNGTPPGAGRGGAPGAGAAKQAPPAAATADKQSDAKGDGKGKGGAKGGRGGGFGNAAFAEGAAWSPNPSKPLFFDQPTENGVYSGAVGARWMANSPLVMANFYIANLKKYKAIAMDVGLQDTLAGSNRDMDALLTSLGIEHTYETYEGDHTNHVKDRFEQKVLPFFTAHLTFSAAKR